MARIGGMELLVVLIVALLAIGPERLPKVARVLGRSLGMFKKTMNDAMKDLSDASEEFKVVENTISDAQREMRKAIRESDEEIKKAGEEADEALGDKPKKKKKKSRKAEAADEAQGDEAPAAAQEEDAEQSA